MRFPWRNVLVLNFGYHNAHHAQPTVPWFRLPALHRKLYGDRAPSVLRLGPLLRSYHRHRVTRVLGETLAIAAGPSRLMEQSQGAHGVSFLTVM